VPRGRSDELDDRHFGIVATAADRATHDAIAPEYRAYVDADAALTPSQKELRTMTLDSWERRITAAEADNE
jgi:hypothetical protein